MIAIFFLKYTIYFLQDLILQLCFTLNLQLDRMVMEMSRQFPRTSYRRLEGVNFAEEAYSLYEGIS